MSPDDGKHDIGAVLEHLGATVPFGTGWRRMRCPLHDDHSPSASVNLELSTFRCWPCDFNGDVYDLLMHVEGCGFVEAQQRAEAISGARGEGSGSEPEPGGFLPPRKRDNGRSSKKRETRSSGPYGSIYG